MLRFLFGWGPFILIIGLWLLFMRGLGGGKMGRQISRSLEHMDRVEWLRGGVRLFASAHKVCTVLVLAIGIVHTVGTFHFYSGLSEAAIWFAGAGLGLVFVALLNIGLWPRDVSAVSWRLAAAANVFFFVWLAAGFSATPGPAQAVVGGLGSAMVITAFLLPRQRGS